MTAFEATEETLRIATECFLAERRRGKAQVVVTACLFLIFGLLIGGLRG